MQGSVKFLEVDFRDHAATRYHYLVFLWADGVDGPQEMENKLQPSTAGPSNMLGCCLISFHFLWAVLPIHPVLYEAAGAAATDQEKNESIHNKIGSSLLFHLKFAN